MNRRTIISMLCLLGAVLFIATEGHAVPPIPKGSIGAPVHYQNLMLVLTSREGAAAVIFTTLTPNSARFKYRFESTDGKRKLSGDGKVTSATGVIKAGPIKIFYSSANTAERAWIYYVPEKVRVNMAHRDWFDDRFELVGDERVFIKKLDLRRFVRFPGAKLPKKTTKPKK